MSDHKKLPPRPDGTLTIDDLASLGQAGHFAAQIGDYVAKNMIPKFQSGTNTSTMAHGAGGKTWTNPFGRFDEADDLHTAHGTVEGQYVTELRSLAALFAELGKGLKAARDAYMKNEANTTADLATIKPSQLHLTAAQQKQVGAALAPPTATAVPPSAT